MQKPPQPPQQALPAVNFSFGPGLVQIEILFGNGFSVRQVMGADAMDELCKQWRASQRQVHQQMEIVRHIKQTRND